MQIAIRRKRYAYVDSERITLPERIREIVRIWNQPAKEVWLSAIGYRPDETYTCLQIVRGVHIWSRRIR